jgi:hypothetical protein
MHDQGQNRFYDRGKDRPAIASRRSCLEGGAEDTFNADEDVFDEGKDQFEKSFDLYDLSTTANQPVDESRSITPVRQSGSDFTHNRIHTRFSVHRAKKEQGFGIGRIERHAAANIPGMDEQTL